MANKIFWTNSEVAYTLSVTSSIKNIDHLAYLNVKANQQIGSYSTAYAKLTAKNGTTSAQTQFQIDVNNDLPSSSSLTYTMTAYATWFGDSKTYTNGNSVSAQFDVHQNKHINNIQSDKNNTVWTTVSASATNSNSQFYGGTGDVVTISWDETTYAFVQIPIVSTSNSAVVSYSDIQKNQVTVSAGNTVGTATITVTANDPVAESNTINITTVNPQFSYTGTITVGGKTAITLSSVSMSQSGLSIAVSDSGAASISTNGTSGWILTSKSSATTGTITVTATNGTTGGNRAIVITTIAAVNPIITPTTGNQGDTVAFTVAINDVKLKGVTTDASGTTMSETELTSAFTGTNCTILSATSDGTNWNCVMHLTGNGGSKANVTVNWADETTTTDPQGVTIYDITLTVD